MSKKIKKQKQKKKEKHQYLTPNSDQVNVSPEQYQYILKQKGDEKIAKHHLTKRYLICHLFVGAKIILNVEQKVKRIYTCLAIYHLCFGGKRASHEFIWHRFILILQLLTNVLGEIAHISLTTHTTIFIMCMEKIVCFWSADNKCILM